VGARSVSMASGAARARSAAGARSVSMTSGAARARSAAGARCVNHVCLRDQAHTLMQWVQDSQSYICPPLPLPSTAHLFDTSPVCVCLCHTPAVPRMRTASTLQICAHGHNRRSCGTCMERCEHGRPKAQCRGRYCFAGKLRGTSQEELKHLAVLHVFYKDADELFEFLDHTIHARCPCEGWRAINVDSDFEVGAKWRFVEYDGRYWHKDKVAADTEKTQVLSQYGSVLRIRDALAPIEGCDNIMVDARKGDVMYRQTFDFIGGQDRCWPAVWQRAQSLAVRTCLFLRDNKVQTLDTFFPAAQPQAGTRGSGRVRRPSVRLREPGSS
jgi:hypothetical protein